MNEQNSKVVYTPEQLAALERKARLDSVAFTPTVNKFTLELGAKPLNMDFRFRFKREILGTANQNPDVHWDYRLSQAIKEAGLSRERAEAELEAHRKAFNAADEKEKSITAFFRDEVGPYLWDYQIRGFLKEAIKILKGIPGTECSKVTYNKTLVDNLVFVYPVKLYLWLPKDKELGLLTRPLRADTPKGQIVALTTSESAPAGTMIDFSLKLNDPKYEAAIMEAFGYGVDKGLGQWRNSGRGSFDFARSGFNAEGPYQKLPAKKAKKGAAVEEDVESAD